MRTIRLALIPSLIALLLAGSARADTITITTAYGRGADASANENSNGDGGNYNGASASDRLNTDRHAMAYVRFDLSQIVPGSVTAAEFHVFNYRDTSSWSTRTHTVRGLNNGYAGMVGADGHFHQGEFWLEDSTFTWSTAPESVVDTNANVRPETFDNATNVLTTTFCLSGTKGANRTVVTGTGLVNFLNADTNGVVTFILYRTSDANFDFQIATKEATSFEGGTSPTNAGVYAPYLYLTATLRGAGTLALASSPNPSIVGSNIVFTATMQTNGLTAGDATGTVVLKDGDTPLSTNAVTGGEATFQTSALAPGSHTIRAEYGGDARYSASTNSVVQVVNSWASLPTTTALVSSVNPSGLGSNVVFTATVQTNGVTAGNAGGTVVFRDGMTPLGSNNVVSGLANCATAALAVGSHSVTVEYSGDGNYAGSLSAAVTQRVQIATSLALASSANPAGAGSSVAFTATVRTNGNTATGAGGTVVFMDGGTALQMNNVGSGVATFSATALTLGTHSITALYSGDGYYLASSSSALAQSVILAANILVSIDAYKQQFKGGGCQSTMWGNMYGSLSDAQKAWYFDWLFCDLNMGYLRDNRYVPNGLARDPNLKLHAYLSCTKPVDVSNPEVYNEMATNWFNHLRDQHAAGQDVNIARMFNEPDYEESKTPGALGYSGNPQKGFAMIIDRGIGRLMDMLADPNINTTGIPRPLVMFPNTLDAGQCVSYINEIKKSTYPHGWGLVDIVSTHQYGSGTSTSAFNSIASAAGGKRMIMSEMYPNRGDSLGTLPIDTETRAVLSLAQLISVPVNAGFDSWWYWQINYDGETAMALLTVPSGSVSRPKHYWGLLQLTSLQPYDSYVLNRTVSGLGSVSVMAMREQKGASHVTLSVANNEGSVKAAGIQLQNAGTNVTPYAYYQFLTDSNNNYAVSGPTLVTPGANIFTVDLRPYSLTTLRILLTSPPAIPRALAHWSLDDGSGTTATDSSGHGYHATLGASNTWTDGKIGGAIQYPADYNNTTANYDLGSVNQLSYSCWFKRGTLSGDQYLGGSTGTNAWSVYHYTSANALRVTIGSDNWDTTVYATPNEWHHLVLTMDVPTKALHLYLDGALRASTTRASMSAITLGSIYWGGGVNGPMDDVWLFNSVLTQSQVESLHTQFIRVLPSEPAATATVLGSSANPSGAGINVTFTATVQTNGVAALDATGEVVSQDNGNPLSTNTVAGGMATFTTSDLASGSHLITAEYSGFPLYYLASTSALLSQVVSLAPVTTTTLKASPNPSAVGSNVTFTATVRTNGLIATGATGTVAFKDGATLLGTDNVNGGTAIFSTSALTYGSHLVRAEYSGNGLYLASTSAPLAQVIILPVPSAPPNLTLSIGRSSLTLDWPTDYLGWILQEQTNALNLGLGTNWTDIPGTALVRSTNLPILPENPAVFYRLRNP